MKKFLVITLVALSLGACQSNKKEEDKSAPAPDASATPQIENTPMNFDASGSDSGKIAGLETIFFEYDKTALSGAAKKKLQGNADWIKGNKVNMQIEGHCDSRGSIEYNLSLGERRAKTVKNYLVTLGVPAGRMSIMSYGKEKMMAQGDGESAHAKNRRANFVPLQ